MIREYKSMDTAVAVDHARPQKNRTPCRKMIFFAVRQLQFALTGIDMCQKIIAEYPNRSSIKNISWPGLCNIIWLIVKNHGFYDKFNALTGGRLHDFAMLWTASVLCFFKNY